MGEDKFPNENIVEKPGSTITIGLPAIDGVSLLVEQILTNFPIIFRINFGEDIADLCIDCVDVQ